MLYLIVGLVLLGIGSNFAGKIFEKIKLPSLLGMILLGMILGPGIFNLIPEIIIKYSSFIKDMALITVLFIGGLGISLNQIKKIGKPAILLSSVPAILEGFTVGFLSMKFLNFTFIQGGILGFIIAAVSPAVLIPAMVNLIMEKRGEEKAIPQLLLVGASADDTIAITLFTTFISLYFSKVSENNISIFQQILNIPISIFISIVVGIILGKISKIFLEKIKNIYLKTIFIFLLCLSMRQIEKIYHIDLYNSLLSIMILGFYIRNFCGDGYKEILEKLNKIWKIGKLYLFSLVGMAINPNVIGNYFYIGILILSISLTVRSIGVLISLIGTELNYKERIFCVIAYLPKATVQSAKAGIPLEMGIVGGEIMQGLAILSVIVTAPIGAILIEATKKKLLEQKREEAII